MVSPSSNFLKNKLLGALSNADLALLQPTWSLWSLRFARFCQFPNKPSKHSYFIEHGLASIVALNGQCFGLVIGAVGAGSRSSITVQDDDLASRHPDDSPLLKIVQGDRDAEHDAPQASATGTRG